MRLKLKRYVTRCEVSPYTWGHPEEWHDPRSAPPLTVFQRDTSEPQDTGLLDKRGQKLFRIDEPNAIGFHARIDP